MNNFEAAWQAVRPVPTVQVDFGNGEKVTRTLHGNIATYVCTANGEVLDILPGIYDPKTYLFGLQQLKLLNDMCVTEGWPAVQKYHSEQARLLEAGVAPLLIEKKKVKMLDAPCDFGKSFIERGTKEMIGVFNQSVTHAHLPHVPSTKWILPEGEELKEWQMLEVDSRINETERRRLIHKRLADDLVAPHEITRWLYKEVLHADLDDPYLGLKPFFARTDFFETDFVANSDEDHTASSEDLLSEFEDYFDRSMTLQELGRHMMTS